MPLSLHLAFHSFLSFLLSFVPKFCAPSVSLSPSSPPSPSLHLPPSLSGFLLRLKTHHLTHLHLGLLTYEQTICRAAGGRERSPPGGREEWRANQGKRHTHAMPLLSPINGRRSANDKLIREAAGVKRDIFMVTNGCGIGGSRGLGTGRGQGSGKAPVCVCLCVCACEQLWERDKWEAAIPNLNLDKLSRFQSPVGPRVAGDA